MKINMCDIKYYPLVDCDTEGTEKVAMFVSTDRETIESIHSMYLAAIVPNYYRLHCMEGNRNHTKAPDIHCPLCGNVMMQIGGALNETKLGLYTCKKCQ